MKTLFRAVLILSLLSSSLLAERITGTGSITSSGGQLSFPNSVGGMTVSVEELISGSPSTVSIVIQGCKNGGTCATLDTYTTVANAVRNAAPGTVYDYFTVSASWTGGSNVSVTINFTSTIARNFGSNSSVSFQRVSVNGASTLVPGDFTLGAGWGSSASTAITVTTSKDQASVTTITASGTVAANPTYTLTFHDGSWGQVPVCVAVQTGGNDIIADLSVTSRSATAYTFQWNGTPTSGKTYEISIECMGT